MIRPRASGGGGPRVAWWRGRLTRRFVVVAREIVAACAPPTALRAVPPPRYRVAGSIALAFALAFAHPAAAQPKTAPPVQYLPQTVLPPPDNGGQKPDLAFGAFQRGYFLTALQYATDGATAGNPPSMTLLGELYANGLGVPQDDAKAADWYKLAAARGDRNAMFALGMFALQGRAGPRDRAQSAKWLAAAANLGHPKPLTISRCSTSRASCSRRISSAPPSFCAPPPTPAARRRNMRSAPSTRTAAAWPPTCRSGQAMGGGFARRRHRRRGRIRHRAL